MAAASLSANPRRRSAGQRGFDAGKKIKGRKRHILTDTQGFLVGAVIHAADVQNRDGVPGVLAAIRWLRHVFADGGYAGRKRKSALARISKWTLHIVKLRHVVGLPPTKTAHSRKD